MAPAIRGATTSPSTRAFIATLPANDPLFVAEFNPALAQLERPQLMRAFGLILENLDGLDDPDQQVRHAQCPAHARVAGLAAAGHLAAGRAGADDRLVRRRRAGRGSLRDFAIGAVTQHFTKSLARNEGPDFKLPSEHQLDAMEAFQLSLGRAADFNLATLLFPDANVETGKYCSSTAPAIRPQAAPALSATPMPARCPQTARTATSTPMLRMSFTPRALETFPHDGGFGQTANPDGSFGNRTFNTAPVVEAADTAPFFHNNVGDDARRRDRLLHRGAFNDLEGLRPLRVQ